MAFLNLGPAPTFQQSQVSPPGFAMPAFQQALSGLQTNIANTPQFMFGGNQQGQLSPDTIAAMNMIRRRAMGGSPVLQDANNAVSGILNSSPNAAFDAAAGRILPQINSQFAGSGRFGSGLHAAAASDSLGRAFAENQLNFDNQRLAAAGLAPALANQDFAELGQLAGIGSFQDARTQEALDQRIALEEFTANEPRQRALDFSSALAGLAPSLGRDETVRSEMDGNTLGNLLGAALTGASLIPGLADGAGALAGLAGGAGQGFVDGASVAGGATQIANVPGALQALGLGGSAGTIPGTGALFGSGGISPLAFADMGPLASQVGTGIGQTFANGIPGAPSLGVAPGPAVGPTAINNAAVGPSPFGGIGEQVAREIAAGTEIGFGAAANPSNFAGIGSGAFNNLASGALTFGGAAGTIPGTGAALAGGGVVPGALGSLGADLGTGAAFAGGLTPAGPLAASVPTGALPAGLTGMSAGAAPAGSAAAPIGATPSSLASISSLLPPLAIAGLAAFQFAGKASARDKIKGVWNDTLGAIQSGRTKLDIGGRVYEFDPQTSEFGGFFRLADGRALQIPTSGSPIVWPEGKYEEMIGTLEKRNDSQKAADKEREENSRGGGR